MKPKTYSKIHIQVSEASDAEDVLIKFITDLRTHISVIEIFLQNLSETKSLIEKNETLDKLNQATHAINENIRSVLDYLHLKAKNNFDEGKGKIAYEILVQFTHILRECSTPLQGFISIHIQCKLSEEDLRRNAESIEHYGKHLLNVFKVLESNWRNWVETKHFDWQTIDLFN